jgi:hypothetical protein
MQTQSTQESLEGALDSFSPVERQQALGRLRAAGEPRPTGSSNVNMHFHSFFSYNAKGFSPTRIAWESRKAGLHAAALCDFDVLDGLEEFLEAGVDLGLRTAVHLETRAFLKEFSADEINSPGEPGVTYIMGGGFYCMPAAGSEQGRMLQALRDQAGARNRALVRRVNPHLGAVAIDYEKDVMPLAPGGCPTERHIVRAYVAKAQSVHPAGADLVKFWCGIFGKGEAEVVRLLSDVPAMEERVRAKLVKKGGLGYEAPTPETFPLVDAFVQWVASCGAMPMAAWLDGASRGESDPQALLRCLNQKGVVAVNIIPDRNWNFADPAVKAAKVANLRAFVDAADRLHMPINIGTEMNRDGLPFVDDLEGVALKPYKALFLQGAHILVGHTIMARYAERPYGSRAAAEEWAYVPARNTFYAAVGALPPLGRVVADQLRQAGAEKALDRIRGAVKKGVW